MLADGSRPVRETTAPERGEPAYRTPHPTRRRNPSARPAPGKHRSRPPEEPV